MIMVVEGMVKPSALVHGSPATLQAPKGGLSARITCQYLNALDLFSP